MPDFEELSAGPYAVPPTEFVAARDAAVQAARDAGDAGLARKLGALRKPTQSAWLVNLLWRERRSGVEQLLDVGAEFSEPQSGESMRRLFARRQQILGELVRAARRLAADAGVKVSADTALEVEETLGAALADPETASQVRSGRLVKPLSYAGFGTPIPPPVKQKAPAAAPPPSKGGRQDKRLAAAEKAVSITQKASEEAESKARGVQKTLVEATRRRDQVREQVRDAQRRLAEAELEVRTATGDLKRAQQAAAEARRDLSKAQRDRDALVES